MLHADPPHFSTNEWHGTQLSAFVSTYALRCKVLAYQAWPHQEAEPLFRRGDQIAGYTCYDIGASRPRIITTPFHIHLNRRKEQTSTMISKSSAILSLVVLPAALGIDNGFGRTPASIRNFSPADGLLTSTTDAWFQYIQRCRMLSKSDVYL